MPFKRNPINAEKIDSLSRELAQMPRLAWDNAANLLLERTLDDSANRRTLLPEAFLIADELLLVSTRIVGGMQVNESAMSRNLSVYSPFAATERVLMAVVKAGADRQEMHERLRKYSLAAWREIQSGGDNQLSYQIVRDTKIRRYLSEGELLALMEASNYLGDAPQRARELAGEIRSVCGE
jgi:adenylosuccinate lyase